MNYLFLTGMFRSGTTLMAKMLDAHPEISFASDPFRPYLNDFRDYIAEELDLMGTNRKQAPLSDYFINFRDLQIMRRIQSTDLNHKISEERLNNLLPIMAKRAEGFSLFIAQNMMKLKGKTYKELYDNMMLLVHECYGKKDAKLIGSKEVWSTEFTSVFLKTFPEMKFIHIIRDPRAIFASRNIVGEKYPWLFLARQWRKLTSFTHLFSSDPKFSQAVLVIRYEDLISNPEDTSRKICGHIGVPFSFSMIDGSKFRDGDGSKWYQNSSYEKNEKGGEKITSKHAEKWRQVLSSNEIRYVEALCLPEMKLFGYEPIFEDLDGIQISDVLKPLVVPEIELANWICEFTKFDAVSNSVEMMKEYTRSKMLHLSKDFCETIDKDLIDSMFLSEKMFYDLREAISINTIGENN